MSGRGLARHAGEAGDGRRRLRREPERRWLGLKGVTVYRAGSREGDILTTIGFTTATRFRSFIRVDVHGAFAGDFIEVALDAEDVSVGDLVTAECVSARGALVATRVTVAESVPTHSSPGADRP